MLSTGAVARLIAGDNSFRPTLQVASIKALAGGSGQQRYRFSLTDGVQSINAMPAIQLNPMIVDGSVKENTVITLTNFQLNSISDQK